MKMKMIKSYSDLSKIKTFEGRFNYLKLSGKIGAETFGFDRVFNQVLYQSEQWKRARELAIIRDNGCDLGIPGREIHAGGVFVHHMNPITLEQVRSLDPRIFNLDFLICTTQRTHNAIHYGDASILETEPALRTKGDTCLWRKEGRH